MSTDVLLPDSTTSPSQPVGAALIESSPISSESVLSTASSDVSVQRSDSRTQAGQVWKDYLELTKPRIVVMILITNIMTGIIGAGGVLSIIEMFWLLIGTGLVAASAGAANQIWERVIDTQMARTASRPLPANRMGVIPAKIFTAILGVSGTALLAKVFGPIPAIAGAATWLLYVLVYTPMKTRTAWNTTVGAIAGALPVLIGYTALGGSIFDATGWLLVGVLVAWQYPHFMSIAWMYRRQYGEAGFQMTTTVEPSGRSAAIQSIAGSLALIGCGIALCMIPGNLYFGVVGSLGVVFASLPMLKASMRFAGEPTDAMARKLLRSSLLVLPAVLAITTIGAFC